MGHAFVNLYYIHEAAKIQVLAMQAAAVAEIEGLKVGVEKGVRMPGSVRRWRRER